QLFVEILFEKYFRSISINASLQLYPAIISSLISEKCFPILYWTFRLTYIDARIESVPKDFSRGLQSHQRRPYTKQNSDQNINAGHYDFITRRQCQVTSEMLMQAVHLLCIS